MGMIDFSFRKLFFAELRCCNLHRRQTQLRNKERTKVSKVLRGFRQLSVWTGGRDGSGAMSLKADSAKAAMTSIAHVLRGVSNNIDARSTLPSQSGQSA
jgi:hypothetical protein